MSMVVPLWLMDRRRGSPRQAMPIKAAAMLLIAEGSGLRGRGTLEEGGPNVVVKCKNVVLTWLVSAGLLD